MRQRDTLVARAIVGHEIVLLGADNGEGGAATPLPKTFTVKGIVEKYGLDWGQYIGTRQTQERAEQLIRNALSAEFCAGRIVAHERDGHYVTWRLA